MKIGENYVIAERFFQGYGHYLAVCAGGLNEDSAKRDAVERVDRGADCAFVVQVIAVAKKTTTLIEGP